MADQIRITPEQMRERASQYRNEADTVGGVISNMDRLLTELQNEWEGAASEAYAERFNDLRPSFVNAEALIRDIAEALDQTAKTVEETDQTIANNIKA